MREIKFRVYDKGLKIMKLLDENDSHDELRFLGGSVHYYNLQNGCGSMGDDSEYVLMEWTGLVDKNGKEIYEGDILRISMQGDMQTIPFVVDNLWDLRIGMENNDPYMRIDDDVEVIGNIYEHGDLIK